MAALSSKGPVGATFACLALCAPAPARPGANSLIFRGRVGGHTPGAGSYRLLAGTAAGKVRQVTFKILS